jgi:hypothetical protein
MLELTRTQRSRQVERGYADVAELDVRQQALE